MDTSTTSALSKRFPTWRGRGIPTGIRSTVCWKTSDGSVSVSGRICANALLFRMGRRRLIAIDPARIPVRLALRFQNIGSTGAARHLFSCLMRGLRAKGPVASLTTMPLYGVVSAAMIYDDQPIVDYFRRIDEQRIMGAMTVSGDDRIYFFELERVDEPLQRHASN